VFVVADQAPVQYQDSVCLLDPPALRLRDEALVLGVPGNDLDVDTETGAVIDDLVLEALVDEGLADPAAGMLGNLVEEGDARGVVVRVRREDRDSDDQARTSTASPRLRPGTRFAGSRPVVEAGTPAAAWTLCVSSTTRAGSSNRRELSLTWQRRSSWMTWSVASSRHAAK
jgi:hypothetical protein